MVAQMILVHLVGVRIPAGELKKIKLPPLFLSLAEAFFVPRFFLRGRKSYFVSWAFFNLSGFALI